MKRLKLILGSLFALLCCLFFESGPQAMEPQSAEYKAYWYDVTGKATLADAQVADYTSYSGILTQGYLPGTTWLRLHVKGEEGAGLSKELVLWIRPTYLNRVALFDPALGFEPKFTGDGVHSPSYLGRPTSLGSKTSNR